MLTKTKISQIQKKIRKRDEPLPVLFNALSDPGRFRIFCLLIKHNGLCVTDLASILGISTPAVSQQLRILEMSGLARKERKGQMICYKIRTENPMIKSIIKLVGAKLST